MTDCVIDATVIYKANGAISGRRPGNKMDWRLAVIEEVGSGARRLRYNRKLLHEYEQVVQERRNDVIDLFFAQLTETAVLVNRNRLSASCYQKAVVRCGWPKHDQHLLAAAIGGVTPSIVVTENGHITCAKCIHRCLGISIEDLS
jgi:hypothetical protein